MAAIDSAYAAVPGDSVLLIETLAANAWPPEQSIVLDGWRLRSARGVTRRANSVWPNAEGGITGLDNKLAVVERYYAALGLPAVYQICSAAQPARLDALLEQRGYSAEAQTHVQTVSIGALLANLPPHATRTQFEIQVTEDFSEDWFALFCACEDVAGHPAAVRRNILRRIQPAHAFALVRHGNQPVAVGLGVTEAGWLGVYSMATLSSYRRQGAASSMLRSLAAWSQTRGAENAYLQVMAHNVHAQQVYARAGFVTAYDYHYRVKKELP